MTGKILVGTASWTDPGFVADWYPAKLPAAYRLRWYAEHFPLVEVNSTFYRLPDAKMTARWCEQTPEDFKFDVKLHRFFSRHSTKLEMLPPQLRARAQLEKARVKYTPALEKAAAGLFLKGLRPLKEEGKLGALLLQLTPGFSPRSNELEELDSTIEQFGECALAIELRNRNWTDEGHLAATKQYFKSRKVSFVMVDAPEEEHFTILHNLDVVTNPSLAYLRAHGRNASGYVRGRTMAARFDYDYSRKELKEIASRAVQASHKAAEVHIVYNNNASDYAPRAALGTQKILASSAENPARSERLSYA